jgi:mRNA-degrading endonuclease RelE of RelBE toxin-antitoxin system
MVYETEFSPTLQKKILKLTRRDPELLSSFQRKVEQVAYCDEESIKHHKNLIGDLSHMKRVHVGHHVLLFTVSGNRIIFKDILHHDDAYD